MIALDLLRDIRAVHLSGAPTFRECWGAARFCKNSINRSTLAVMLWRRPEERAALYELARMDRLEAWL